MLFPFNIFRKPLEQKELFLPQLILTKHVTDTANNTIHTCPNNTTLIELMINISRIQHFFQNGKILYSPWNKVFTRYTLTWIHN